MKVRVEGYEFRLVQGSKDATPYVRMENAREGAYMGAIPGVAKMRRLRDFLTAAIKRCAKP